MLNGDDSVEYMWLIWLILAIVFLIIESITIEIVTIWFAIGSLISMITALIGIDLAWQITWFTFVSIILIIFARPLINRLLKLKDYKTNIDSLIGKMAIATSEIRPNEYGEVKVNEAIWKATCLDKEIILVGQKVTIKEIIGNKLVVKKYE